MTHAHATGDETMTMKQFHERMARVMRAEAARPETPKKWREKLLRDAKSADKMAREMERA